MSNYGIDDIKSLSFRDGVRTRIQMYLGSDDNEGTYQALKEIINNSTDEALAGYGKKITITVNEQDNYVSVTDEGRGVPFGIREDGENVLVSIYSKSHTGGKFEEGAYKNASGLNGIGAKCVCLSAEKFEVQSIRDERMATAYFEKGLLINYNEVMCSSATKNKHGTYVRFKPDSEVFKNGQIGYSFTRICNDIHNISYLYTGIEFIIINDATNETKHYCAKNGISDFVKDIVTTPMHQHIITSSATDGDDKLEIAFQWGSKSEQSYVFVNGLQCPEGGSPITGAKTAITRTFNSLASQDFNGDSIRNNLTYVINCSVAHPSFANQTKTKINNANLRTMASNCFTEALKRMKAKYENEFNKIVELLVKVAKADAAAEKARNAILKTEKELNNEKVKRSILADKLKDCKIHDSQSSLIITEGDSAMNGLALGRDDKSILHNALFPIRGKIISALKNSDEDVLQNEEVKAIFSALGCGFFENYKASKLRYGSVACAADQDQDGNNIFVLLVTLFYHLCPQFLKEGRLYRIQSPLYILHYKDQKRYAISATERDNLIQKYGRPQSVGRVKGLGELNPDDTATAIFGAQKHWDRLVISDWDAFSARMELIMSDEVPPRKEYIMNNVDFSRVEE